MLYVAEAVLVELRNSSEEGGERVALSGLQSLGELVDGRCGEFPALVAFRAVEAGAPPPAQRREVDRLADEITRIRTLITSILPLADELKRGTIETVLAKSDFEVGLGFLLGKRKP